MAMYLFHAAVRLAACYGAVFACFLLYLALFSVFGVMMKMILTLILFGVFGLIGYLIGLKRVVKVTKYPAILFFLLAMFGMLTLSRLSDITTNGSFVSELFLLLILGGLGIGVYAIREKAAGLGFAMSQVFLGALMTAAFAMSFQ